MKKFLCCIFVIILCISGCSSENKDLNRALTFRQTLENGNGCSFEAVITADYGDRIYAFTLNCISDDSGIFHFTVMEPETIRGISGEITEEDGQMIFDGYALAFEKLADGYIAPVSAPWLLMKTLRSGYIRSCGMEDQGLRIILDDSYEENPLQVDVWFNGKDQPEFADFLWDGRRIISLEIKNFQFL